MDDWYIITIVIDLRIVGLIAIWLAFMAITIWAGVRMPENKRNRRLTNAGWP